LRFGIPLTVDPAGMHTLAREAEEAGCDSAWMPEHLIWPAEIRSRYPYSEDGRAPVSEALPAYDPWVLLAWVSAATERLRLGTSVYILPLRDPHVTARAVATLDLVSGGRAILGAGVGWLEEEFEIAGQRFADRGARADEITEILRALWSPGPTSFAGAHYSFPDVHFEPKPPQGADLPIVFGGESAPALRRAARLGSGWIGLRHTPDSARERIAHLRTLIAAEGREDDPFEITVGAPSDLDQRGVDAYVEAGVDRVCLRPWRRDEDPRAGIERLGALIASVGAS
jgi:probable F420-dependent oxidoreductase